jgi:hypothetical protein
MRHGCYNHTLYTLCACLQYSWHLALTLMLYIHNVQHSYIKIILRSITTTKFILPVALTYNHKNNSATYQDTTIHDLTNFLIYVIIKIILRSITTTTPEAPFQYAEELPSPMLPGLKLRCP